jgi:hypothetical protein
MRILVDSSVLLDVTTQDPRWAAWSEEKLAWHAERHLQARKNPIWDGTEAVAPHLKKPSTGPANATNAQAEGRGL